ncbi:Htr4.2 family protein [Megaselia abdita]
MLSLGLILGTFLICWLPIFTFDIFLAYFIEPSKTTYVIINALYWLGLVSYCSDPFIYAFQNKGFRHEAIFILKLLFRCKNEKRSVEQEEVHNLWAEERRRIS